MLSHGQLSCAYMLAILSGLQQGRDDGALGRCPVEGRLYGQHVGVLRSFLHKPLGWWCKAMVGVLYQYVSIPTP